MKKINCKLIALTLLLPATGLYNARSDTIHLTNQREMVGIIEKETDQDVVLDVGCGTVTIGKNNIESIERSSDEEKEKIVEVWKAKYLETGRWIPEGSEEIFLNLKKVKENRIGVIEIKRKRENIKYKLDRQERSISKLYDKFEKLNIKLKEVNKEKDVLGYNDLIADVNTTWAKIGKLQNSNKNLTKNKGDVDSEYSGFVKRYTEQIVEFAKYFKGEYEDIKKKGIAKEDEGFYAWLEKEIRYLHDDFNHNEIDILSDKQGVVVSAVINDRVTVSFVVDTGASLVVISQEVADKLNISEKNKGKEISLVLADGKKVPAIPVKLDSIDVHGSKAKNVLAAVMEDPPASGIDGLLGMTYLNNFIVGIDPGAKKLILEEFNP